MKRTCPTLLEVLTWKKNVWTMRVPHFPSHDVNQRVQKELLEKWCSGRAGKAEGGPGLELVFRGSPRSEAVKAKQPQG